VFEREKQASTYLDFGWAVPHARIPGDGEMLCSIGWSPSGIKYDDSGTRTARIIVMYYIPDSEKHTYLKEISSIAKALKSSDVLPALSKARDLNEVRGLLLDLTEKSMESAFTDNRARMIRLKAKIATEAVVEKPALPCLLPEMFIPFMILSMNGGKVVVLSQDNGILAALEAEKDLSSVLKRENSFSIGGISIVVRQTSSFMQDRVLYDCIAVRQHFETANTNSKT